MYPQVGGIVKYTAGGAEVAGLQVPPDVRLRQYWLFAKPSTDHPYIRCECAA